MKKVVRLTETDLVRLVKKVIEEQKYSSFGNPRKKDFKGDEWIDDKDRYVRKSEELYGLADPEEFDTEEFDDYDSYREKYPDEDENTPRWFGKGETGRKIFDTYREKSGRPFKVKTKIQKEQEFEDDEFDMDMGSDCDEIISQMKYIFKDFMRDFKRSSPDTQSILGASDMYHDLESELGGLLDMAEENDCENRYDIESTYEELLNKFRKYTELDS